MASVYQAHLRSLFGPHVRFVDAPLGASEAPLTVPIYDGRPGGLLAYHTVYYEFLAVDGERRGEVIGAHDLRQGNCYSVIVSQQSGLYRYHLQDLVRVESHLEGIPRLSYQGRYVEHRKVQEHQWLDAVRRASAQVPVVAFCAMPQGPDSWCVWIEFSPACVEADRVKACHDLATWMCEVCSSDKEDGATAAITVIEVDQDGFHVAWQAGLHAGRRAPQVKDLITCATPLSTGAVRQTLRCRLTMG
jgi:hypothetical protein